MRKKIPRLYRAGALLLITFIALCAEPPYQATKQSCSLCSASNPYRGLEDALLVFDTAYLRYANVGPVQYCDRDAFFLSCRDDLFPEETPEATAHREAPFTINCRLKVDDHWSRREFWFLCKDGNEIGHLRIVLNRNGEALWFVHEDGQKPPSEKKLRKALCEECTAAVMAAAGNSQFVLFYPKNCLVGPIPTNLIFEEKLAAS